jgi:DNA-binding HxlR family transcriptional regulator
VCSIDAALRVIGEKWSLLIVRELMMGCTKYAEIVHNTGVPRDILTKRLRFLERAGVIYRQLYNEQPPRYEYRLATAGEQLQGVLVLLRCWGEDHARNHTETTMPSRHRCTARLKPEVRCASCGEMVGADSLIPDRGVRRSQLATHMNPQSAPRHHRQPPQATWSTTDLPGTPAPAAPHNAPSEKNRTTFGMR